jgi:threonine dehydrogenase-like Zn-dependent dehydrogenase
MEFARIAGAKVIAMDVQENRLAFCKDKLKVDHTINPLKENARKIIRNNQRRYAFCCDRCNG